MSFNGVSNANQAEHAALDSLIQSLLVQRADARANKDWTAADQIRDALAEAGIAVKDATTGSSWSIS